jgi:glycosyltransferase involved in cell wall biosynthesis
MLNHPVTATYTVCICTHNRISFLKATIDAVLEQELPSGRVDILVVDSASSDGTFELVSSCYGQGTPIPIRCVREEQSGLSRKIYCDVRRG